MSKFAKALGISVLTASLLMACSESTIEKVDEPANKETQGSEAKDEKKGPEIYNVGDTIQFDNLTITLTNVRVIQDDFMTPQKDKLLAVELDIENTGDETENVSSLLQMSLMDVEGYQQDITISTESKGSLDGEIGAGRKMKGEVVFDVVESDSYEFIFEDPFTSGQAIWKINAGDIQ